MTKAPVVRSAADVQASIAELGAELRRWRGAASITTRQVAEIVGISTGTLWRLEAGLAAASWVSVVRAAAAVGAVLELDDGSDGPRTSTPLEESLPEGYWDDAMRYQYLDESEVAKRFAHWQRLRIGAELWWARQAELSPPLGTQAAADLLGLSRATLRAVERGPLLPRLHAVVHVAGLTGRRLTLAAPESGLRMPPWVADASLQVTRASEDCA